MSSDQLSVASAIKGSAILELSAFELEGLSSKDFLVDGDSPAFIIGFVSPGVDLERAAKKIKSLCDCQLVLTQTAGELCSKANGLYLDATPNRGAVLLQLISKAVLDSVFVHTISLPCEDILSGRPSLQAADRVGAILKDLECIDLPFKLDAQDTVALTLINGLTNCESWFMEAAYQSSRFPVPFIGGTTAGNLDFSNAPYHDGVELRQSHATICFLKLNSYFRFRTFMSQNFEPAGFQWVVGHADVARRTVSSFIDRQNLKSQNVLDALCATFSCAETDLEAALSGYSFAIKVEDDFYIRSVAEVNFSARSLSFYCDIPLGTELYLMKSTDFVEKTHSDFEVFLAEGEKPKFGIFFDCILRRLNNSEEIQDLSCFRDYPVAGFSTFGELFGVNVNETLSALFVCERDVRRTTSVSDFAARYAGYSRYFYLLEKRSAQLMIEIQERVIAGYTDVLDIANNSTSIGDHSLNKVETIVDRASSLKERLHDFDSSINDLNRDFVGLMQNISAAREEIIDIDSMVSLVDKLTDQTQLLATSASSEAARSGGSTQDFVDMASEVSALASSSRDALGSSREKFSDLLAQVEAIIKCAQNISMGFGKAETNAQAIVSEVVGIDNEARHTNDLLTAGVEFSQRLKEVDRTNRDHNSKADIIRSQL